jgi:cell division protein ZapA (FtsZ GTPase activity inhibitor)
MSSNFCYVTPKNGLAKDAKINTIVAKIIQKVADIPNHNEYRGNMELLKMICIMIEHAVDNKEEKIKIDKKDIVFQIYTRLWNGMKPDEIKNIENNIQFLWENGQIKKKGLWSVVKHSVCDWVSRKILN